VRAALDVCSKVLVFLAGIWCFGVGYYLWTEPYSSDGRAFSEVSSFGIAPLLIPGLITLLALGAIFKGNIRTLLVLTGLLWVFWLISGFSIGMAYTPAAILLGFASIINLIEGWRNKKKKT
jgi:hypothetical protein